MQVAEVGVVAGIVVVVDGSKAAKLVVVIRSRRDELVVEVDQGKDIKMLIFTYEYNSKLIFIFISTTSSCTDGAIVVSHCE